MRAMERVSDPSYPSGPLFPMFVCKLVGFWSSAASWEPAHPSIWVIPKNWKMKVIIGPVFSWLPALSRSGVRSKQPLTLPRLVITGRASPWWPSAQKWVEIMLRRRLYWRQVGVEATEYLSWWLLLVTPLSTFWLSATILLDASKWSKWVDLMVRFNPTFIRCLPYPWCLLGTVVQNWRVVLPLPCSNCIHALLCNLGKFHLATLSGHLKRQCEHCVGENTYSQKHARCAQHAAFAPPVPLSRNLLQCPSRIYLTKTEGFHVSVSPGTAGGLWVCVFRCDFQGRCDHLKCSAFYVRWN